MKTEEIIKGMIIISKYYKENDSHCGAEHDIIYMYATDLPINSGDLLLLFELGWFQKDIDASSDFSSFLDNYDEEESWECFS